MAYNCCGLRFRCRCLLSICKGGSPLPAMQAQDGVDVQLYSFLTWTLDWGGCPRHALAALPRERSPGTACKAGCVGLGAGLDGGKGLPRQAEVAEGVPGRLRPRIFLTFWHYKGGRSSAKRTGAFTPGEIPGTHFQRLSRPQGTWFCRGNHGKNPQ